MSCPTALDALSDAYLRCLAACCPGVWTQFTIQPLLSLSVQTDTSFFSSPNHTYHPSPLLASSELILNFF
ncbi:hypothetical protein PRUPE_1G576400 [Prunus persica]|uniref:Uncharacterized protein n=1 Tax=Prunus persica TaxID=3760 RepID=A0A251RN96_PRUPE|nr:hypothetical protein PRUPE_1G576400 [Prunus persica]